MRPLSLAALFLLSLVVACRRAPVFVPYADPAGRWSLDAPKDWIADPDPVPDHRPVWAVEFIGAKEPQMEGRPLGAVLTVTRQVRRRADFPGDAKAFKTYDTEMLAPLRALFGDDAPGPDEKQFDRSYDVGGGPFHGDKSVAVRAQGAVYRTPDAYYVMEYLAAKDNFAKYHYAYERARLSFAFTTR